MKADAIVNRLLEIYSGPQPEYEPEPEPEPSTEQVPTISIGTIFAALPPGVDAQAINIMNQENNTSAMARRLIALLAPHAAALETIGILPDYLAWMLVTAAQRERGIQ